MTEGDARGIEDGIEVEAADLHERLLRTHQDTRVGQVSLGSEGSHNCKGAIGEAPLPEPLTSRDPESGQK